MAEKICYEFDDFRLEPTSRKLLYNGQPRPLRLKAFELLLFLVKNHRRHIAKDQLIKQVWPEVATPSDNTFNVTLNEVRKVLGESKRDLRHIIKVPDGYCFIAEVQEVVESQEQELSISTAATDELNADSGKEELPLLDGSAARFSNNYFAHLLIGCSLYAALYATCVVLEIAYQFDHFGRLALRIIPFVFAWVAISSATALVVDRKLTLQGKSGGLGISTAIFLIAAGALFGALSYFLPSFPITESSLQTYPAQAAYLKDTAYFLVLGLFFPILPFHFIMVMEREGKAGRSKQVLDLLTGNKPTVTPKGATYPRFWVLVTLLTVLVIISLIMTTWLLDHLKPWPYMNLFIQLVYFRGILYFGLGVECLVWYYRSLADLKRESLIQIGVTDKIYES